MIVVAGGGHNTLNVGSEGSDFVPFFYNYGINTIILRNRLRRDGYDPKTDAVDDMLQAIKVVRAYAEDWGIDPKQIGAIGFSAGAELTSPAAIKYRGVRQDPRRRRQSAREDQLAPGFRRPDLSRARRRSAAARRWRSRPTRRRRSSPAAASATRATRSGPTSISPRSSARASRTSRCTSTATAGIPGDPLPEGGTMTGGLTDRSGIPLGTWQFRFIDWFRDLGFLQKPGVETKAARDVAARVANPPRAGQRGRGGAR